MLPRGLQVVHPPYLHHLGLRLSAGQPSLLTGGGLQLKQMKEKINVITIIVLLAALLTPPPPPFPFFQTEIVLDEIS